MKNYFRVLIFGSLASLGSSLQAARSPEDVVGEIYIEAEKRYYKNDYVPMDPRKHPQYDFSATKLDGPSIYGIIARLLVKVDVGNGRIMTVCNGALLNKFYEAGDAEKQRIPNWKFTHAVQEAKAVLDEWGMGALPNHQLHEIEFGRPHPSCWTVTWQPIYNGYSINEFGTSRNRVGSC